MLIGLVKWFDFEKGFGIISTPNGDDFFLHINSFSTKPDKLLKATPIVFSPKIDTKKNRNSAENSRLIWHYEDWKLIFNYLGKSDTINIELEVTGTGKYGNQFHRKEIHPFSLMELSLKDFLKNKSENEIRDVIIGYFETELEFGDFIEYCEIVEKGIKKQLPIETANNILNAVYSDFGNNLNEEILFHVWKKRKFKYISYTDKNDYEIPKNILISNIIEIGIPELRRILSFSFGSEFCAQYIDEKFENIELLSIFELIDLYQFLEFINESELGNRKQDLDHLLTNKIIEDFNKQLLSYGLIKTNEDLNNYNRILQNIPIQINEDDKIKIRETVNEIITERCSEEFKLQLWIKGIVNEIPFDKITAFFIDERIQIEELVIVLTKVDTEKQFELLKRFSSEYGIEKAYSVIQSLVKRENSLSYYFNLSEVLFVDEFWKDKKCSELIVLFETFTSNVVNDEQKFILFLNGFARQVPLNIVRQKIDNLSEHDCKKILRSLPHDQTFIKEILETKLTLEQSSSIDWLYDLASQYLDKVNFETFDKKVFDTVDPLIYFSLWEKGKSKIFPKSHIEELLNDKFFNYDSIQNWINRDLTTTDDIVDLLLSFLKRQITVADRMAFYKQLNHIKFLFLLNENILDTIKHFQNNFYNIILWFLDKDENLNINELKLKFIYFSPEDQVRIIRKLFYLKANGQFDLTIEKLQELTRFDLDLYHLNAEFNPDIPVDISTEVVIQALSNFAKNGKFLVESEILKIVLKDIGNDRTRRFRLVNYFEKCLGRTTAVYDWSRNGVIRKVDRNNGDFYFEIEFEYDPDLVDKIKMIPGRQWNSDFKKWVVPSTSVNTLIEFAKANRFYMDFGGNNYANNIHLANFNRVDVPIGISFCEGRQANKPHDLFKKTFWWCANQPCFEKCETQHQSNEWEKYTLLDFCEILGFNTNEINRMNDFIDKGLYYQFIGLVNRFNRLLDKLYCSDCDEIMFPVNHSNFAAYSVVRFNCNNKSCANHNEVYLNHCLNGQCGNIIDSRTSQKCDNGLFICDQCGSCCSHSMLSRRMENLNSVGGFIHENLKNAVTWKLGHLERAEYTCYKCAKPMTEIKSDVFECGTCNIKYETTNFRFKRIHKGFPKGDSRIDNKLDRMDEQF